MPERKILPANRNETQAEPARNDEIEKKCVTPWGLSGCSRCCAKLSL